MTDPLAALSAAVECVGKPAWRPLLHYVAELHQRSVHPARAPLPHEWEEIGPGYCYGPAFGHWDIVHQIMDSAWVCPGHARTQLRNDWANQQDDGLVPGSIWMRDDARQRFATDSTHPPVWPVVVDALHEQGAADQAFLGEALRVLDQLIGWFDSQRAATPTGYFYTDIRDRRWESGVDEGIRFLDVQPGPFACVDACSHLHLCLDAAARWAVLVHGEDGGRRHRADALGRFIAGHLYAPETGFFHDHWSVADPASRCLSHEGIWPLVSGAASAAQAATVAAVLADPRHFATAHPIPTVARSDPRFEGRMWRGPAWNSIGWWAARGLLRYGHRSQAADLLEAALDQSARIFALTGTVWEFYDSLGGDPRFLKRKPHTPYDQPCRDYLGHNPLIAMALLWDEVR